MSEEIWKNIEGYDNYSISSLKNVKNTKKNTLMTVNKNRVILSKDGKRISDTISSLMYKYFRGYDDFTGEIWKNIEDADNYSISSLKNVKNTKKNTLMTVNNNRVKLNKDGKTNSHTISCLMHKYFRGYDDFTGEIWKKIEGFDYDVSTFGRVRNRETGNISVAKPNKKVDIIMFV